MFMGIYLLAGIVFVLFIVFLIDFFRDSKNRDFVDRNFPFPRYGEEFGEDDFYTYDDYRYYGYYDYEEEMGEELGDDNPDLKDEEEEFNLNFKDEFGEDIMHDLPIDKIKDDEGIDE